jgi:hypothetical protein
MNLDGSKAVIGRGSDLRLFQMLGQKASETAIAEATSGNSSTIIRRPLLCKVFCDDQAQQHRPECRGRRRHVEHGSNHCR